MISAEKFLEHCPFCKYKLFTEDLGEYAKSYCNINEDHTFVQMTISETKEVVIVKLRLGTEEQRNYMKLNYISGASQVWRGRNDTPGRVNINEIIKVDLSNPEEIIKKIKLYVTLS